MNDRHVNSPYPIRMPNELRDSLARQAAMGNRSLHAEIIKRLQDSIGKESTPSSEPENNDEGIMSTSMRHVDLSPDAINKFVRLLEETSKAAKALNQGRDEDSAG